MRKVRERRSILVEDTPQEQQRKEMEKRAQMYELSRKEQIEDPHREELIKKFQGIFPKKE
jgi:hypothetical protein